MKRIEYLKLISNLFQFRVICDEKSNEYVVFEHSALDYIEGIQDRTEFEALENHVHILDNVKADEFQMGIMIAQNIGPVLLNCLQTKYPQKRFVVYVSLRQNGAMIVRFHQKWEHEEPYYNSNDFISEREKVFTFEEGQ